MSVPAHPPVSSVWLNHRKCDDGVSSGETRQNKITDKTKGDGVKLHVRGFKEVTSGELSVDHGVSPVGCADSDIHPTQSSESKMA